MIAGRFKLVIFDCDGVLVDSEPIINRVHAEVLTACGYPITEKVLVERFCGMSDPEMLEIIEREWGLPQQKPPLSCRGPMVRIHLPPRIAGPNGGSQKGLFLMRYRWFESISLQRRVINELFRRRPGSSTSRLGHVTSDALDHALLAAAQLDHVAVRVAYEH
jgi:hypothetical protein